MAIFDPANHTRSDTHRRIYVWHKIAYTTVDFLAAVLFIVGSILFFDERTTYAGTWLFLIGSIFFALRPTTTLVREVAYGWAGRNEDTGTR